MQPVLCLSSIFLLDIFIVCQLGLVGSSSQPDLCVVNSPLITPYFTPLLETPRKAHGCSKSYLPHAIRTKTHSHHSNNENQQSLQSIREVHVVVLHVISTFRKINVRRSISPIRLTIHLDHKDRQETDAEILGRLTLVLHSDQPVAWELMVDRKEDDNDNLFSTPQSLVVVSQDSTVEGNFSFNLSTKLWSSKKALHRYIKKEYQWISSYTEVKEANHMELKVGSLQNHNGTECDMSALKESPVLTASLMVELKTEGCFHEDYIGDNPVDAYIIELDGSSKRSRPNRAPLPVLIHLHGEGTHPVSRNVTLVLKSHQPIIWQFGANGIRGNIVVVSDSEDQVENSAVGGSQNLEVRSQHLPDSLSDLLILVATNYAPPILYAKTGHASELRLLIGTKSKAGLRSGPEAELLHGSGEMKPGDYWRLKEEEAAENGKDTDNKDEQEEGIASSHELMEQQPSYPGAALVSGLTAQEPQTNTLGHLSAAMVLDCGKSRMTASFPASLVSKLGVKNLTLNDPNCVSKENRTHILLSSLITSCGTTSKTDGKIVSATNAIHVTVSSEVENDDEDFEESSGWYTEGSAAKLGKIPVECKYQPIIHKPKSGFGDDEDPFVGSDDVLNGINSNKMSPYHMEIYRDKEYTQQVDFFSPEASAKETEFDETLYVRAWIDGAVPVQVVTEGCWISNSSNPEEISRFELLRNTCPVDLSVQIQINMDNENSTKGQHFAHGGFSFQVNKEYESLGQFYVHCRLGLCASDPEYLKGNLMMCVDSKQYCSRHSLRPFLDKTVSTAQQLVSKGPLRPVPRRKKTSSQVVPKSTTQVEGRTKIIYVGVSTEVTIGIALASFAIGVGLTGALWCIHMKTDPFRRHADKQLPGSRAVVGTSVTACNLSPHSGCSSTNSQTAMTST